jgi:hypothetical protein
MFSILTPSIPSNFNIVSIRRVAWWDVTVVHRRWGFTKTEYSSWRAWLFEGNEIAFAIISSHVGSVVDVIMGFGLLLLYVLGTVLWCWWCCSWDAFSKSD